MILETMLADMESAPALYRPTRFWASCLPHILNDIARLGVETFRSHPSGLNYYVPSYGEMEYTHNRPAYEQVLNELGASQPNLARLWRNEISGFNEANIDYHILMAADKPGAPELSSLSQSSFGNPVESFVFDGKTYSAAFLRYLKCLAFLKKNVPAHRIRRVLEIGGGYGVLGEIICADPARPFFYVNVDIPPVAYVATVYLKHVLGESAVADYLVTRDLETIDPASLQAAGYRAVVLCPWQLPRLRGPFELFANSASFQEMEPAVVANYAEHVTRLTSDFLMLKNSRHGKALATEGAIGVEAPTRSQDYLRHFDAFQLVATDAATFGMAYAHGFASDVMIFKRK